MAADEKFEPGSASASSTQHLGASDSSGHGASCSGAASTAGTPTDTAAYLAARAEAIAWMQSQNLPPLPVAPAQDPQKYPKKNRNGVVELDGAGNPKPLFTGKNPSYLDRNGVPRLLNHHVYQTRLPSIKELETWFAHPANGVGTLGGWNEVVWLDFDAKCFPDADACDVAVLKILELPDLQRFVERTHSGGWRVGVRVTTWTDGKKFTNFALEPGGAHVGEALGVGRFTVLAPTIGPSGNPYESLSRNELPEVESLEAIGIYPAGTPGTSAAAQPPAATSTRNTVCDLFTSEWTERDWAVSYLHAIHSSAADDYHTWLKVGMALHSVDQGLLSEWDAWSRQSPKFQGATTELESMQDLS